MALTLSRRSILIISILSLFIVVSFILRALPVLGMDFSTYQILQDPDMWYNYRQIEVMVAHFPQYNWFDPMTAFPTGKDVDWGPAFPFFAAILAIITGATQRTNMMFVTAWVPVIFALLMIPLLYSFGRMIGDWKTGVIAAIFIALAGGGYFFRSYVGVVDHHIAEVFFTTLFGLFFIVALLRSKETEIRLRHPETLRIILLPSLLAGVAFGISLLTSPTCILFLGIVGIYTILQYVWDIFHQKSTDYLAGITCLVSLVVLGFLVVNGFPSPSYSLTTYSVAQIHVFILFILGIFLLQLLSMLFREKPYVFTLSVAGLIAAGIGIVYIAGQSTFSSIISGITAVFSTSKAMATIVELRPWSLTEMWTSFNIGIILSVIGLVLIAYHFVKKGYPANLYISVWALLILSMTALQIRWEYYAAVVISLLSAYALGYAFLFDRSGSPEGKQRGSGESQTAGKKKSEKKSERSESKTIISEEKMGRGTMVVVACLVIFCGVSIFYDYAYVLNANDQIMPPQWIRALEWVQTGTPDPGVSYLGPYESEGWEYPEDSYGVLSWWDNGHAITFISKRIPVTNPFQDHAKKSAQYFILESEEKANSIADADGTKYVITDWRMKNALFRAIIEWADTTPQSDYYAKSFRINSSGKPEIPSSLTVIDQHYYLTMISRLQNFDGSLTEPSQVIFIVYSESQVSGVPPTISAYEILNISSAREKMRAFESQPHEGKSARIFGFDLNKPVEDVSALHHYRLVYEDTGIRPDGSYDFNTSVKVFEYVPGAKLAGEGLIEAEIRTNLGRTFTYRQESEDGWFTLPYSTKGGMYPVSAVGPYHIISTGKVIDVTDDEVLSGKTISG
jgi:dolichyl-diphosphooligosaccharide--protein glycosyltransferase